MATTSVAQVLMRKGKRGAATYVHSECNRTSDPQHLYELLDLLLNPAKPIDDSETVDWIKWLTSGGKTPVEFASTIRRYDNGTTCGLVWTANFVAYRCRTCGISPCMSLCAECFQKGDHQGHDFNMFRSQAGGACDCGDTSVMKESGFCDKHGPQAQVNKPTAPRDLLCVAEAVMPRIFLRVIQHLRENSLPDELEKHLQCISEAEPFLNLLHEYSSLGAALRRVMTSSLINPTMYAELTEVASGETEYAQKMKEQQRAYEEALRTLPGPDPVEEYKDLPPLKNSLVHRTFLEELVFWTVKFEFPQKLVCLLLNMLPDPDYKEAFTRAFVLHYARISRLLVKSSDADTLSNRVVHVSVQLFSNEDLAFRMVDSLSLLHVLVVSLKDMMSRILIPSTLQDAEKNFHFVVDCSEHVMKDHCYWPLVSDLSNVLSHKPVALRFLSDDGLLEMWFSFLAMFQGMNVNQREMNSHVEFEPNTYYAAFSAELEAPASTMWALLFHLKDAETSQLTLNLIRHCITALQDWFDAINFTHPDMSDPYQVSFHLPLHRYLATFTCQAVRNQGIPLNQLLPPPEMLHLIMMHPLRIQVSFYEILCGLWVRNGLQIKGQAMTYIQCHFGNSMVDADLYLLQLCATHLPAPTFWMTVLERFHVLATLSVNPQGTNTFLDAEHEMPMLESWLTFMASILNIRTNIGLSERDLERLEMVSLLCMSDRTHSQLMELLPEKCGAPQNKDFDAVLAQVADYRAPNVEASGSLQQGHYVPKPEVWEQLYDPIYVLLRAVHRRDFQTSMDRFTQFMQQTGRWKSTEGSSNTLWPPFRLPGPVYPTYPDPRIILQSGTAHAVIWSLLYKAFYAPANQLPEQILALTVYLLDMAVSFQNVPTTPSGQEICVRDNRIRHCEKERLDMTFQDWFDSDYVAENVCIPITRVKLIPQTAVSLNSTDGGEIDVDSSDGEMDVSDLPSEMIDAQNYLPLENSPLDSPVQYRALTAGNEVVVSNVPNFQVQTVTSPLSPPSPFRNPPLSPARNSPIVTQTGPLVLSPRVDAPPPRRASGIGEPGPSGFQGPRSISLNGSQGMLVVPRPAVATEGVEGPSGGFPLVRSDSISSPLEADSGYALPPSSTEYVETRESIISLLLKLHSKMTGTADSYEPATPVPGAESSHNSASLESRIGDGPFFVRKVLDKLCAMDARVRDCVQRTRQELWPRTVEEQAERKKHKDSKEREEKRMKAKERQQKLMAEFASRQKQFMKQAMQESEAAESMEDSESAEPEAAEAAAAPTQELYDCVICNQTTPSSIDRPVCLVVLIQATSVVGHRRLGAPVSLPMTEVGRPGAESLGADWERRMEVLSRNFEETSWLRSVNSGFQGGVHLQTCGHYLHLDCQKAYLASLRTQQRQQSLAVERGEFACPLCRQLANSVLPVAPEMGQGVVVSSQNKNLTSLSEELQLLLLEEPPIPVSSVLVEAMGSVMEHMTSSTFPRYRQVTPSPSAASMLLFVCSIARTNLEIEILQRDDQLTSAYSTHDAAPGTSTGTSPLPGLSSLLPKRSCLVPLLHVLAMHSKLLTSRCNGEDSSMKYYSELWNRVTGLKSPGEAAKADSLAVHKKDVPLLLSDASSLLLQFLLVLPLQVDKSSVLCLVQGLYNVAYFQQLCQLCLQMGERGRALWRTRALPERAGSPIPGTFCGWDLALTLGLVLSLLEHSPLFLDEDDEDATEDEDWSESRVEEELQKMLLPFMRVSALLVHHLYKLPLPVRESAALSGEFAALSQYLGLVSAGSGNITGTSSSSSTGTTARTDLRAWHGLRWAQGVEAVSLIRTWCEEVCEVAGRAGGVARSLMVSFRPWNRPRLLGLPENYDVVFQYYHHRPCANCTEVPKEPSLCLVCGKLVCLRENCCRRQNMHEAVQHSVDCGAGTAIFLAVNSCTIIVIRGKRACLWGSVYLDAFGEEDRDLKRGKPLFLSKDRYQLLEMQWLAHRFDHTNKKWIWHRDVL